ncbi:TetR/AcrR family transcriptional regulator [Lentilactobacillus hilgardii]|nr:TetR/AcrR family transcriptional regulator [Lentilactobacillus hilgardii]MCP9350284.1 TetR/AcrR family transcriptional regulator [Lentilactobacillus hilgardii]MCP9353160.1 TetR/AcrR family transcriptional regulator [Lentilactobacillus hilgardii]
MVGKTNNTKNNIVTLTIRKIKETGYQGISLRKLLAELHLTTGSFYKHFDSKDDLFRTVTATLSERLSQQARQTATKEKDPLVQLIDLGEFIIIQFKKQPNLMGFLFFNNSILDLYQHNGTSHFPLLDDTHQLIKKIMAVYPTHDCEKTLFVKVWAFIQGYAMLIQNNAADYDRVLLTNTAKEMIGVKSC